MPCCAHLNENAVRTPADKEESRSHFIRDILLADQARGTYGGRVVTRFPPEPNGYLHIGHAKSIVLNFGLAEEFGGVCHLRMDDTNPETEDMEYVRSIQEAIRWLGYEWADKEFYASDYFEQLYQHAETLIRTGLAYVDSLSEEDIRTYRGTVLEPGRESPYRSRAVEENLELFREMRAGVYPDGAHVLRAKIDMASPNMLLRDPVLYRIRHAAHYRTGEAWCIYPMYDYAHPLSDAIEGITHSVCTLEFEVHRPLYDWLVEALYAEPRPRQYEFARLNVDYLLTSKRKLLQLVQEGHVTGWDDPRMPTLFGLRRRGVPPEALRTFCERIGVTKTDSRVDIGILEHALRDDLNFRAPRALAVLRPLKVVLTNYPEGQTEWLDVPCWPHDIPKEGTRPVPFTRELFIERDDFMEAPPKAFYRLAPGREVRLRYGYFITCQAVVRDAAGEVVALHCTYDPATTGGNAPDGRSPKGTIHWVSAAHALPATFRLYDRLFTVPNPDEQEGDFRQYLNPNALEIVNGYVEPGIAQAPADERYQFERLGYFWQDPQETRPDHRVFNRIIGLRDSWAKASRPERPPAPPTPPKPRKEVAMETTVAPPRNPLANLDPMQQARVFQLTGTLGVGIEEAAVLVARPEAEAFFYNVITGHNHPKSIANWIVNVLLGEIRDRPLQDLPFTAAEFSALVALVDEGTITTRMGKDVLAEMIAHGGDPWQIVTTRGLTAVSDPTQLAPLVDLVLEAWGEKVLEYRSGKTGLLGFFTGQVLKESGGKADPETVQALLRERLG
jgi:glutaminyl-tRNA synthetase